MTGNDQWEWRKILENSSWKLDLAEEGEGNE
jgi:hypothetical protein